MAGIERKIDFERHLHLFPLIAGGRLLYEGDVISELNSETHGRVDTGIGTKTNHNQLVHSKPLELEIQVGVREAAGTPVFLRHYFTRKRSKFVAKGASPRTGSEEMTVVTPRLNRCNVLPCVAFILKPSVPVVWCEKHRYAGGTSCLESRKHVRYAVNRFRYFLDLRPQYSALGDEVVERVNYEKARKILFEYRCTHRIPRCMA